MVDGGYDVADYRDIDPRPLTPLKWARAAPGGLGRMCGPVAIRPPRNLAVSADSDSARIAVLK